jgi:phosphoglycolate phosphatase
VRLVVFDMDGTLLDTEATILRRVAGAFAAEDLTPPPEETIRAHVGMTLSPYMATISGSDDHALVARLVANYRAIAAAEAENAMPLFEGARAMLDALAAVPGTLLGIATGKGRASLDRALEENGIAGHFQTVQTPDTNPGKPNPGMLLAAMAECGTTPGETVMVGDALLDIEMARAACVAAIGVAWGMHKSADLQAAGAAAIASRIEGLPEIIDGIRTP